MHTLEPSKTALVIVDLQNDFLHAKGAYGRAGQKCKQIADLPMKIAPIASALRQVGGVVVATQFTLVPGKDGSPLISEHLKKLRPFLTTGDFAPGSWGQDLVEELKPADFLIEKVAYSAFHMSRLEWVLRKVGIDTLIFAGIVTNGGVASTVRDAHVRDFTTIVLEDGCAAFSEDVHSAAIADMASISTVSTCAEIYTRLARP